MISIVVYGIPRPGGSKTPGVNKQTDKLFVRDANPLTAFWRADVQYAALEQYKGELLTRAISMTYDFRFPRPKSHYGSGKNSSILKLTAPFYHTKTPDLTKLIRSTEDALTGIVWRDDCLVYTYVPVKRYCLEGEHPGATIEITEAPEWC